MVRREVRKKYLLLYLLLFLASGLLFVFRLLNWVTPELKPLPDFLLVHITNPSLSFLVLLTFGFTVLVFGGGMKWIIAAALLIAAFNLTYELLFPITNTPDALDAIFGLIGTTLAYIFLLFFRKNGLVPKENR